MTLFSGCLPGWSAQDVIDTAVLLGFSAIEWATGPEEAIEGAALGAEVRELYTQAGLHCSGLSVQDPAVTLATPKRALAAVELAVALGAPYVRLFAPRYQGGSLEHELKRIRDGLGFLVDVASPHGLAVLVETSPGTLAPTPDSALALIEEHAPATVGVLYDPGNMIIEGHVQPRLAVARLHDYLLHVHVKNVAWSSRGGPWRWRYARLAGGMADWPAILQALATAGYRGRFSIDHLPGRPTRNLLRDESETFSQLLQHAFPH